MKQFLLLALFVVFFSCKEEATQENAESVAQDSNALTEEREYAVLDSKVLDTEALWKPFEFDTKMFTETKYSKLKP